jgi:hypothetical protein
MEGLQGVDEVGTWADRGREHTKENACVSKCQTQTLKRVSLRPDTEHFHARLAKDS